MMIPVRCFSCGRPIAQLWESFNTRVASGEDPGKVLDELGVVSYCCRAQFLTNVDVTQQVAKYKR
ncbi:MAG: DNA-directed RNA polymerase subunit N [Candidatus Aenigmarchaeota archaeon]|nr:DNA-directed RNA polymerase subunit N [Candidatus Aenigmarchaeota archaeon]